MATIEAAVTALLTCGNHVFVIRRQDFLNAFPGYWAFPGGRIEPEDDNSSSNAGAIPAVHNAALERELQEELGWSLNTAIEQGVIRRVQALGSATTPRSGPRRFEAYFYHFELSSNVVFELDPAECVTGEWVPVQQLLAEYEAGQRLIATPTLLTLQAFAENPQLSHVPLLEADFENRPELMLNEPIRGLRLLAIPSYTLPPAEHTNVFLLGDTQNERILVDPSPKNEQELEKLEQAVEPLGFSRVMITHHHPDHRQFADVLARKYNVPLCMSAMTQTLLQNRGEQAFLDNVQVELIEDGQQLCHTLGKPVRALAVPGHDAGHLALMPDDRSWCIVGDLIQGVGTVVIQPPEGDMAQYFDTMQRMIDLDPKVIVPSHGIPMGGTYRLQATLEHRRQREQKILEIHKEGGDVNRILRELYGETDQRLWPLAEQNIRGHLGKLQAEGRIGEF